MKSQTFFLIFSSSVAIVFGDESTTDFVTITLKVPAKPPTPASPSAPRSPGTPAATYNWNVAESDQNLPGCNGGWRVNATALCKARSSTAACSVEQTIAIRASLNGKGVQGYLVRADTTSIDITQGIVYLCLQDGCDYIFNRRPPATDLIQFFGIGNLNPLTCTSTAVTQTQSGSWNVAFQYNGCQNVPKWLQTFYEGQDLTFAGNLLKGATSVNLLDCTQFNNVDQSKVTFTLT